MSSIINQFFDYFSRITGIMMEQRLLGAVVIMALFAILAALVDFFIHRIINYIRKKSNVDIDNTVIGSIHRPAWIILVLIGALLSTTWLKLDPRINYVVNAILKTLLIIVFTVGLGRLIKNLCHQWWVKRRQGRQIIHMFENVGRVLVLLSAAALFLLIWKIDITAAGFRRHCGPGGGAGRQGHSGQFFWRDQHSLSPARHLYAPLAAQNG